MAAKAPPVAGLVAKSIRNAIIRGELKNGDSLPGEAQMMKEFDVARTTIREAVRILEYEGLICQLRGGLRGAKVLMPSADIISRALGITFQFQHVTVADLYEMRTLIEPPAAALAAARGSRAMIGVLERHIAIEKRLTSDLPAALLAVARFHGLILECSGNKPLGIFSAALTHLFERHFELAHRRHLELVGPVYGEMLRVDLDAHAKLVDLIADENAPGAEAHWRAHMTSRRRDEWSAAYDLTCELDVLN